MAEVTTRPFDSTNQRSLASGFPDKRACIQSATKPCGVGPRLVAGTLPTECRQSWYTTSCLGQLSVRNRRSVCSMGDSSSASPCTHRYGTRIFSAWPSHVSVLQKRSNADVSSAAICSALRFSICQRSSMNTG